MSLFQWIADRVSHRAVQQTALWIPDEHDLTKCSGTIAVADRHYVRLRFSELFLEKDAQWFTTRFPLGYSLIAHKYGDQPKVEFSNVAGKTRFDIPRVDQGRSVLRNYTMTPLLPFRGGEIEVDCGLVSMEAGNLLESFAKTVGDIAGKLNVPQASTVVGIASSIASGVQELLGAGAARTVLVAHDMFTDRTLSSGYLLLANRPLAKMDRDRLWMTAEGVRVGPSESNLAPLEPQDYMVVQVECMAERDDWQSFSAIGKPLDEAVKAKLGGRDDESKLLLVQSKMAALTSPDLTRTDAKRVIAALDRYFNESVGLIAGRDLGQEGIEAAAQGSAISHFQQAMVDFPPGAERDLPEPTLESILRS